MHTIDTVTSGIEALERIAAEWAFAAQSGCRGCDDRRRCYPRMDGNRRTIDAFSEGLGKGAVFTVRLPRAAIRPDTTPSAGRARSDLRESIFECSPELTGLSVLVVDDEPDAREVVSMFLLQCGCIVRTAGSAAEALTSIADVPPAILLSDIGMPGEDGYSLIRRVRALPREQGGAIPAAALTAYASADDRRRSLLAGFQMHVPKPVDPSELVAVVTSLARIATEIRRGDDGDDG